MTIKIVSVSAAIKTTDGEQIVTTRPLTALFSLVIIFGTWATEVPGQVPDELEDLMTAELTSYYENGQKSGCDCGGVKGKGAYASGCRCHDGWCGPWRLTVDILRLGRNSPNDLTLVSQVGGAAAGATLLSASNLDLGYETGVRIDLYHRKNDCVSWQIGYSGDNWNDQRTVLGGAQTLLSVDNSDDYEVANQVETNYFSDYDSLEINRIRCLHNTNFTWLVGVRHVGIDETFNLASTTGAQTSDYNIATENSIWSAQFGLGWIRMLHQRYCIGLNGKIGIGSNSADQTVLLRDDDNVDVARDFTNGASHTTFNGEFNAALGVRLPHHPCWYLRGGYQLLWFNNVAIAPEQFQNDLAVANAGLNIGGNIFLSGFFLGLDGTW